MALPGQDFAISSSRLHGAWSRDSKIFIIVMREPCLSNHPSCEAEIAAQ